MTQIKIHTNPGRLSEDYFIAFLRLEPVSDRYDAIVDRGAQNFLLVQLKISLLEYRVNLRIKLQP